MDCWQVRTMHAIPSVGRYASPGGLSRANGGMREALDCPIAGEAWYIEELPHSRRSVPTVECGMSDATTSRTLAE